MRRVVLIGCAVGLVLAACCACATVNVTVPGYWSSAGWWVDTGLYLTAGNTLHISATGEWSAWDIQGGSGPDGYVGWHWYDQFFCADGNNATASLGALIGYIGPAPPQIGSYAGMSFAERSAYIDDMIVVGSEVTATVTNTGELFLGQNDDAYSGNCGDNWGYVTAKIDVGGKQVPELPASALAALPGFGLLGAHIRRRGR